MGSYFSKCCAEEENDDEEEIIHKIILANSQLNSVKTVLLCLQCGFINDMYVQRDYNLCISSILEVYCAECDERTRRKIIQLL